MKSTNQEECVLCCREIEIYATGLCDHQVCYECSTRMRVLCETNECPICRSEIPIVVFTQKQQSFSSVSKRYPLINQKYQIIYENDEVKKAFEKLLLNECPLCKEIFPTFDKLRDHVRRKHELFYCDLCNSSIKIFTSERKCYNRKDLARHKIKGDPDQKSHRGHPLCEYCDVRYVDHDDLYRHLRREHFFCHFCDADGLHQYYVNYDYLRQHFRIDHYLCEEGECVNEKFTAVFRSEIDLKAHKAVHHSKNKSKAEARQARMLDLEFNYVSQPRLTGSSSPRGRKYQHQRRNNVEEPNANDRSQVKKQEPEAEPLNTQSTQDFPYLSEEALGSAASNGKPAESLSLQSFGRNSAPSYRRNLMSADDFPALGLSAGEAHSNQIKRADFSSAAQLQKKTNENFKVSRYNVTEEPKMEKPGVKKFQKQSAPNWLAKKDSSNFEEAFPKLEMKKTRSVHVPVEDTRTTSLQNSMSTFQIQASDKNFNGNLHNSEEQFVTIKPKSKKKPLKSLIQQDKEEVLTIKEETKKPDPLISANKFSFLSNQENKDPVMRFQPGRPPRDPWEPDPWETKVSFGKDDFPPLADVKKSQPSVHVKKSRAPPPGFTNESSISSNTSLSLSDIAQMVGNSKRNNLNSQTFNHISPQNNFSYSEPPNLHHRNEKLLYLINEASQTKEKFNEFKSVSRDFRCNTISGLEYQRKCLDILGEEDYQSIFPELVALLPDIPKQQELLSVHNQFLNDNYSNSKRKYLKNKSNILSCNVCNQVLVNDDCDNHKCIT